MINEKQILTNVNLTETQKMVLVKTKSAPTEKVAYEEISYGQKTVAARDQLVDLELIEIEDGRARLTQSGEQLMKDESLLDDTGEITPEAQQYIDMKAESLSLIKSVNILVEQEEMYLTTEEITFLQKIKDEGLDLIEVAPKLYDKIYGWYANEMPYGVQKARTGDPDEWIFDHLDRIIKERTPK